MHLSVAFIVLFTTHSVAKEVVLLMAWLWKELSSTLVMTNMKEQKENPPEKKRKVCTGIRIHKALIFADRSATARVPVRSLLNNITGRHGRRIHISSPG